MALKGLQLLLEFQVLKDNKKDILISPIQFNHYKILDPDLSLKRSGSINLMRWVEAPWTFPPCVLKASNCSPNKVRSIVSTLGKLFNSFTSRKIRPNLLSTSLATRSWSLSTGSTLAICSKSCNFMEEVLTENSTLTKFKTINDFQWNLTHAEIR